MLGSREIFEERFKPVLEEARRGEVRCLQGRRWGGNALLIVVDAALDSIGLSYFKTVVPINGSWTRLEGYLGLAWLPFSTSAGQSG